MWRHAACGRPKIYTHKLAIICSPKCKWNCKYLWCIAWPYSDVYTGLGETFRGWNFPSVKYDNLCVLLLWLYNFIVTSTIYRKWHPIAFRYNNAGNKRLFITHEKWKPEFIRVSPAILMKFVLFSTFSHCCYRRQSIAFPRLIRTVFLHPISVGIVQRFAPRLSLPCKVSFNIIAQHKVSNWNVSIRKKIKKAPGRNNVACFFQLLRDVYSVYIDVPLYHASSRRTSMRTQNGATLQQLG